MCAVRERRSAGRAPAVGLVGGLGPESTIDYYRRIIERWRGVRPGSAPPIMIDSLDVDEGIRLVTGDRAGLAEYVLGAVERLAAAGCDFVAMAANTPHVVFDEVADRSPVPLISIVDACTRAARAAGARKVGLLGTRFTMEADLYPRAFERMEMEVVTPTPAERDTLHALYIDRLLAGVFDASDRKVVKRLGRRLIRDEGVEAIALAGTELPLLLSAGDIDGVPLLDTAELHVAEIVTRLLEGPSGGSGARRSPRLQPLRVPAGWCVQWNSLDQIDPQATEAGFGGSSLFSAVHGRNRFWIDVEWRPEFDPAGEYRMRVEYAPWERDARGRRIEANPRFDASETVHEARTRDRGTLVRELDAWLDRCAGWTKEGH